MKSTLELAYTKRTVNRTNMVIIRSDQGTDQWNAGIPSYSSVVLFQQRIRTSGSGRAFVECSQL